CTADSEPRRAQRQAHHDADHHRLITNHLTRLRGRPSRRPRSVQPKELINMSLPNDELSNATSDPIEPPNGAAPQQVAPYPPAIEAAGTEMRPSAVVAYCTQRGFDRAAVLQGLLV